jgi:hypothetical protein
MVTAKARALALLAALHGLRCGGDDDAAARALAACRARRARVEDLATGDALVRHLNALPAPVTVPCVLASLPRPLAVVATTSELSAQPAGVGAPRVFVLTPAMVLSVVAAGEGAALLEFGERVGPRHSVKGELRLPPAGVIDPGAAFARVRVARGGTSCGACHHDESAAPDARGAFASFALRPVPGSLVPLERLRAYAAGVCLGVDDVSAACLFWRALFDGGAVVQGEFPADFPTITSQD